MEKRNFIIIGFGKHAQNVLLPAIVNSGGVIDAIVCRSLRKVNLGGIKFFADLNDALRLFPYSHIVIATPPDTHFQIISTIPNSVGTIFVEKPLVTSIYEYEELYRSKSLLSNNLVELMMYKYTNLFKLSLKKINSIKKLGGLKKLSLTFKIPSFPSNTFRDKPNLKSSIIYDIGCYIFSFLFEIGFKNKLDFKITEINQNPSTKIINDISLSIVDNLSGIKNIEISFGIGKFYENSIKLIGSKYTRIYSPFFNGKALEKKIEVFDNSSNDLLSMKQINDSNGFENIFRSFSKSSKIDRENLFREIYFVNSNLDKIEELIRLE